MENRRNKTKYIKCITMFTPFHTNNSLVAIIRQHPSNFFYNYFSLKSEITKETPDKIITSLLIHKNCQNLPTHGQPQHGPSVFCNLITVVLQLVILQKDRCVCLLSQASAPPLACNWAFNYSAADGFVQGPPYIFFNPHFQIHQKPLFRISL